MGTISLTCLQPLDTKIYWLPIALKIKSSSLSWSAGHHDLAPWLPLSLYLLPQSPFKLCSSNIVLLASRKSQLLSCLQDPARAFPSVWNTLPLTLPTSSSFHPLDLRVCLTSECLCWPLISGIISFLVLTTIWNYFIYLTIGFCLSQENRISPKEVMNPTCLFPFYLFIVLGK